MRFSNKLTTFIIISGCLACGVWGNRYGDYGSVGVYQAAQFQGSQESDILARTRRALMEFSEIERRLDIYGSYAGKDNNYLEQYESYLEQYASYKASLLQCFQEIIELKSRDSRVEFPWDMILSFAQDKNIELFEIALNAGASLWDTIDSGPYAGFPVIFAIEDAKLLEGLLKYVNTEDLNAIQFKKDGHQLTLLMEWFMRLFVSFDFWAEDYPEFGKLSWDNAWEAIRALMEKDASITFKDAKRLCRAIDVLLEKYGDRQDLEQPIKRLKKLKERFSSD